ncbi:MAG TPA: hypothetical protein VMS89_06850 [Methanoregulaceae archaeon]|nr:hypothetical protein [Methanoregulaceae archaeon]
MSKYYGLNPETSTKHAIEQFENEVIIRHNNQMLVGTVYVDMQNDLWAVGVAYNLSHHPGLHGREHELEVRYSYSPEQGNTVKMFRSDPGEETQFKAESFSNPDAFVRYVVTHERNVLNRPAQ